MGNTDACKRSMEVAKSFERSLLSATLDAIRDMMREYGDEIQAFYGRTRRTCKRESLVFEQGRVGVVALDFGYGVVYGAGAEIDGVRLMVQEGGEGVGVVAEDGRLVDAYRYAVGLGLDDCARLTKAVAEFGHGLAGLVATAVFAVSVAEQG